MIWQENIWIIECKNRTIRTAHYRSKNYRIKRLVTVLHVAVSIDTEWKISNDKQLEGLA